MPCQDNAKETADENPVKVPLSDGVRLCIHPIGKLIYFRIDFYRNKIRIQCVFVCVFFASIQNETPTERCCVNEEG